jgi:hypothetical protein
MKSESWQLDDAHRSTSLESWVSAVAAAAKGLTPDELVTETWAQSRVAALYTEEVSQRTRSSSSWPARRERSGSETWRSRAVVDAASPEEILRDIRAARDRGIDEVRLIIPPDSRSARLSLGPSDWAALRHAAGPWLSVDAGAAMGESIEELLSDLKTASYPHRLSLGLDPIRAVAAGNREARWLEYEYDRVANLSGPQGSNAPVESIAVDTSCYRHAGADGVQELAFAMATAVDYLRAWDARGVPVSDASGLSFFLRVGPAFFRESAKLRAARILWARVLATCGVPESDSRMRLAVAPSLRCMTVAEPWVNMLRATSCVFSGIVGGADVVESLPFDACISEKSEYGGRVAEGALHIARGESSLGSVVDPAGGSYFLESLTQTFAEKAWSLFQQIESQGGMAASLKSSRIQEMIAEVRETDESAIRSGRQAITGVTIFADSEELGTPSTEVFESQSLRLRRLSEPYELLRARSDRYVKRHGRRPEVGVGCVEASSAAARGLSAAVTQQLIAGGLAPAVAVVGQNQQACTILCIGQGTSEELARSAMSASRSADGSVVWAAGRKIDGSDGAWSPGEDVFPMLEAIWAVLDPENEGLK